MQYFFHFLPHGIEGIKLGKAVAIGILHNFKKTYNENFSGFCITKFDGTTSTI